ncbi:hypothetical protein ACVME8_009674 [Bradyrhizobium diazoefficiens]
MPIILTQRRQGRENILCRPLSIQGPLPMLLFVIGWMGLWVARGVRHG